MRFSALKISLYLVLFLIVLVSDLAKGLLVLFLILVTIYVLFSYIYGKIGEHSFYLQKDAENVTSFDEFTEENRPARDEISSQYSSDRYSEQEIEQFIEEIGDLTGENLSEMLDVEAVREMPDKGFMELKDMPREEYEPIFDVKKDDDQLIRVQRHFPTKELLEEMNKILEGLETDKYIFLYRKSKILVLNEKERKSIEEKYGSNLEKA